MVNSGTLPAVHINVEEDVDISGERQWLGQGNAYGYGIYREKSDDLEVQIERELESRGYGPHIRDVTHVQVIPPSDGHMETRRQRSWWRNMYDRVSQSSQDAAYERANASPALPTLTHRRKTRSQSIDYDANRRLLERDYDMDDPPPPSIIRQHRSRCANKNEPQIQPSDDILAPLSLFNDHMTPYVHRQYSQTGFRPQKNKSQANRQQSRHGNSGVSNTSFTSSPPTDSFLHRAFPVGATTESGHAYSAVQDAESNVGSYEFRMAGQRNHLDSQMVVEPYLAQSVEVIHMSTDVPPDSVDQHNNIQFQPHSHIVDLPAAVSLPFCSPSNETLPSGLQRSSAQIYLSNHISTQNSQFLPPDMPLPQDIQVREWWHRQNSKYHRSCHTSRRQSAPIQIVMPAPFANPTGTSTSGNLTDNITKPIPALHPTTPGGNELPL